MTLKEFREKTKDMPENTVLTVGIVRWGEFDIREMDEIIFNALNDHFLHNTGKVPTLLLTDHD